MYMHTYFTIPFHELSQYRFEGSKEMLWSWVYVCISNNAGQPNSVHPSGRCTPEGSGIVDTATMLPEPDVQPSSETSFCTSPLPTDTSAPTEHPVTTHEDEVSHKLDHEGADSPRLDQDDSTLSRRHPNKIRDHCR